MSGTFDVVSIWKLKNKIGVFSLSLSLVDRRISMYHQTDYRRVIKSNLQCKYFHHQPHVFFRPKLTFMNIKDVRIGLAGLSACVGEGGNQKEPGISGSENNCVSKLTICAC